MSYRRLALLIVPCALIAFPALAAGLKDGSPVDITSQQLDIEQSKNLATFTGNVVVKQDTFVLTAPKVVADYASNGQSGQKGGNGSDIKSITATGGVTINRGEGAGLEKAVGSTAVYSPATQQILITGAVTLTRGPSTLSGDKLVYDMASGNARVTNSNGPVKARFVPNAK